MLMQFLKTLVVSFFLLPTLCWADSEIRGDVEYVFDGDTITVRGVKVRLNGLHAPEWDEPGGREATLFMKANYLGKRVRCVLNGERSYDRMIGICYGPDDVDIAAKLVAAGLGRDCRRYSGGRYRQYETKQSRRLPLPGYCK